jgi:hypothetical protein
MKRYQVIEEFVDVNTGDRFTPAASGGDAVTFTPHDETQEARLLAAGCLRAPRDGAAIARDQINNDGLFDQTVDGLKEIAEKETIDLGDATRKADIVAAIRAARAA